MITEDTVGFFGVRMLYQNRTLVHFECGTELNNRYFQLIVSSYQLFSVPRGEFYLLKPNISPSILKTV